MTQKDFMPPNGESTRNGRSEQGGLLDEAKNVASHLATEAKDEASSRVSSQKDRAAKSLSSVADALRGTKNELDDSIPAIGQYADKAADTVQQLSEYIRSKNIGEIIDTVEHFARRESALFLGGTAALGLLAGRFLRSSRPAGGGTRDYGYDRSNERGDYRNNYERAGRDFGGSVGGRSMSERNRSGSGTAGMAAMGGKIGGTNNTVGSSDAGNNMGTGMGAKPNVGQPSGSGANIGVQKVGSSSTPPAGQAAQREMTKPGGFTSNLDDGSAGTGPATGSNMPPKKAPEVK